MPLTPVQSAPYPALSDPPNGPAQIQALANWAETQVVMRFANASARDAALSAASVSPAAGMLAWLDDKGDYSHYSIGSGWTNLATGAELGFSAVGGTTDGAAASFAWVTTGNKVTLTLPVTRKLRVDYWLAAKVGNDQPVSSRVGLVQKSGTANITITDPLVQQSQENYSPSGTDLTICGYYRVSLSAGTYTFGLLYQTRSGHGFKSDELGPSLLGVYDAGPA